MTQFVNHLYQDNKKNQPCLWLPNSAPQTLLLVISYLTVVGLAGSIFLAVFQPSLGITWVPLDGEEGLMIKKISHKDNALLLKAGDRILYIQGHNSELIPLSNAILIEDPDLYSSYNDYNRFFDYQDLIVRALMQSPVTLIKDDQEKIPVVASKYRKLSQIPSGFWANNLSAAACFLISAGIWCYRRGQPASRLFVLAGMGFFGGILCMSIYSSRELVINKEVFIVLSIANHFFMFLWTYSLYALLWYYPQPLGNRWILCCIYLAMFVAWSNETWQWIEIPLHPFYITTFLVPYLLGIPLAVLQWQKTSRHPVERAALKWFLLSIFISLGVATAALIIPPIYKMYRVLPFWMITLLVLLMFVCLALGILRYQLFNLERWWFLCWVWFFSGALIMVVDLSLIYLLQMNPETALIIAILLAGWVYFPLRQWLWMRLMHSPEDALDYYLPSLLDLLFSSTTIPSFLSQWEDLLKKIFTPLSIKSCSETAELVHLSQNGLMMQVPGPDGHKLYKLAGNRRGTKLFGPHEVALANTMLKIAKRFISIKQAEEQSAAEERDRIMRDLHDDVGAKLLILIHRTDSEEQLNLAQSALRSLKETIYTLKNHLDAPVEEIFSNWYLEVHERLESLSIQVSWHQPDHLEAIFLTPRQYINCGRILREAVSNIIKHAQASQVTVNFDVSENQFFMAVADDGNETDIEAWVVGNGLNNMRKRAQELSGNIVWIRNCEIQSCFLKGISVKLSFSLKESLSKEQTYRAIDTLS